jgi:hypothetical protein
VRPARGERIRSQRGASLVELAIVIPFLVLLALGAIDFGRAFYLSIEVANAARAGVQYGAANGNLTNFAGMETAANADAFDVPGGVAPNAVWGCECSDGSTSSQNCSPVPTCPGGASGPIYLVDYVQVYTSATYTPLIPWPGIPLSIPMSSQAKMRLEQ